MNFLKNNLPSLALITISIAFLLIGTLRGEHLTVLEKAVRICLECIGIG